MRERRDTMIEIENMIDERQQKLHRIADHYQEKQLWKLAEECGDTCDDWWGGNE